MNKKENTESSERISSKRIAKHDYWPAVVMAIILFTLIPLHGTISIHPLVVSFCVLFLLIPYRKRSEVRHLFWLAAITVVVLLWFEFKTLLTPFMISFALAFLLNPMIKWISRIRMPKWVLVSITFIIILGCMALVAIFVIPQLIRESRILIQAVPGWIDVLKLKSETSLLPWLNRHEISERFSGGENSGALAGIAENMLRWFTGWSANALQSAAAILSGIANLTLIPVITVYLLVDYDKLKYKTYAAFPDHLKPAVLDGYRKLNDVLSAYLRGQLIVVLFLAIWISTGLTLFTSLPYAVLIGITAGVLNLLPYIGPLFALIFAIIVSAFQPDAVITIVKVIAVFISGQTLEGNLLTPRIVGDRVGLSPLTIIFVFLLFASLLGFVGMLIAIPLAASIKVIYQVWSTHLRSLNSTNVSVES